MRVKINITDKQIETCLGYAEFDLFRCPVKLALRKKVSKEYAIITDEKHTVFDSGKYRTKIEYPKKVAKFLAAYDIGERVGPMSFTLEIPKKFLKV